MAFDREWVMRWLPIWMGAFAIGLLARSAGYLSRIADALEKIATK